MSELRECPFCGGEAEIIARRYEIARAPLIKVRCKSCNCQTDGYIKYPNSTDDKEAEAIAAWNRRVDGWISVETRAPDFGQQDLTYCPSANAVDMCYYTRRIGFDIDTQGHKITHWRPLPLPPEA
jgi:Lar family restriction alleviation protein